MDGVMRPILHSIIEQCINSGLQVSNALAAIVLRAIILKNADGMQMEAALKRSDLKLLVQTSVDKLLEKNSPSLETMKLQVAFESKLIAEHERLEELSHQHTYNTKNLLAEVATLNARGAAALEVLYRKAVTYMIAASRLGESTDVTALKETTAVLETVFPREELQAFIACTRQEREFQMEELSIIVAGIRLLNREIGKGGECIEDVPALAFDGCLTIEKQLAEEMKLQKATIDKYTAAINHHFQQQSKHDDHTKRLQDEANNHQQFLSHTTTLMEDVIELKDRLTELKGLYQESISGLKTATADPTKTPPEKVFPMFMTLAKIWQQIEKERSQLSARENLFKCLLSLKGSFTPSLSQDEVREAQEDLTKHPTPRITSSKMTELEASKPLSGASIIDAKSIASNSALEIKGFCPWTIVKRGGMLVKGDASSVIVRYQGKYYALSSDQAIAEFVDNPNEFIDGVVGLAKEKPELIFLLELQSLFPSMQSTSGAGLMKKGKLVRSQKNIPAAVSTETSSSSGKKDAESQTESHPIPSYIDRNYCWNEWELRRNAIKLVELRYKATHSTQTKNSHFRRENFSQHYAPKNNDTQTGISTGTNPPIKKNYVTGLRGKPTQKVKVVKLEFDL